MKNRMIDSLVSGLIQSADFKRDSLLLLRLIMLTKNPITNKRIQGGEITTGQASLVWQSLRAYTASGILPPVSRSQYASREAKWRLPLALSPLKLTRVDTESKRNDATNPCAWGLSSDGPRLFNGGVND